MSDVRELALELVEEWDLVNQDNRRWREPPLGIASFLDWYEETGRIPDDVDREDLFFLMDCYL